MTYIYLLCAILSEVAGTAALQASQQFTRLGPLAITIAGYVSAFFFLSLALKTIPLGIAYAIWSGLGIVLISLIGFFWFGQRLDPPAILGLTLIVTGVAVVNLFSKTIVH
jgi:small multidrug resistance pump